MSGQNVLGMEDEAVASVSAQEAVRIVGFSVRRMEHNKKPLCIKLKLNGATHKKLPSADMTTTSERCKWNFEDLPLNLQADVNLTVKLQHEKSMPWGKPIAQMEIPFDQARSFLDSTLQTHLIAEYQVSTNPEMWLHLDSSTVTLESHVNTVVQNSREIRSALERLGKWQAPLTTTLEVTTAISEANPYAKAALSCLNVIHRKLQAQVIRDDQIRDLVKDLAGICNSICDFGQFAHRSQLDAAVKEARPLMEKLENILSTRAAEVKVNLFTNDNIKRELDKLNKDYIAFQRRFDRGIMVSSAVKMEQIHELLKDEKAEKYLKQLRPKGVEITHPPLCMDGTREDILLGVDSQLRDVDGPNVIWIRGHPGVGKSAIVSTLATRLRAEGRLGSYFVFEHAKAEILTPSTLWRLVGYDLAKHYPSVRQCIIQRFEAEKAYLNPPNPPSSQDLFEHFVEEPLKEPMDIPPGRMPVIIIDAFDECGGLDGHRSVGRRELLKALKRWPQLSTKLKLIITSRPEEDIVRALSSTTSISIDLPSGKAVTSETSKDINTFFTHHFHEIAERFAATELAQDWPGQDVIDTFTTRAAGLFIWATTAVDLIGAGDPPTRLQAIIDHTLELGNMARLYSLILNIYLPTQPAELEWFRILVSAMILAKRPLNHAECAGLLEIKPTMLRVICGGLRSVLDESGGILRFTHQSFVDFLLNPNDCPKQFRITELAEAHHAPLRQYPISTDLCRYLVNSCLRTMTKESMGLRFNICGLETSSVFNVDVPDIEKKVRDYILSHLSYGCFFWADHLSSVPFDENLMGKVKEIVEDKFLYWLEVMSLSNEMNRVDPALRAVLEWSKTTNDNTFLNFLRDAIAFVRAFARPIAESTPHIYISALPFAPTQSLIAQHYLGNGNYSRTITVTTGKPARWPSTLFVTEHHKRIGAVAFSPDQRYFASCGHGDVYICDAESGNTTSGPFESPTNICVAFCAGGRKVAYGSKGGTVRVWDIKTGVQSFCLHGSGEPVRCMANYNDGGKLATYSDDGVIMVWDTESGKRIGGPLQNLAVKKDGWNSLTKAVVFSTDGQSVISGSCFRSNCVDIWDVRNGDHVEFLLETGSEAPLYAMAFSPDGWFIAGGSFSGTVCTWSIETRRQSINLDHGEPAHSLAYSADGKCLVSASYQTVRVWDVSTSQIVFTAESAQLPAVALSANPMKLVLGSSNGTVRMWDLDDVKVSSLSGQEHTSGLQDQAEGGLGFQGERIHLVPTLPKQDKGVVFSPCGKKLASIFLDVVRVWDVNTGKPLKLIRTSDVSDVAFSSDGKWIVSLSKNGSIHFWDIEGKLGHRSPILGDDDDYSGWDQLAFLPDGRGLIYLVGLFNNKVRIWDPKTMKHPVQYMLSTPDGPTQLLSVTLLPDGTKIIGEDEKHEIHVWSTEQELLESTIPITVHLEGLELSTGRKPYEHMMFSQSGKLAYLFSDRTLRVWDVKTGRNVATISLEWSYPITVSPDDHYICLGTTNGFDIYNIDDGRVCGTWYDYHTVISHGIRFSPDGMKIAQASYFEDGVLKIWDASDFTKSSEDHFPQQPHDLHMDDLWTFDDGWVKTTDGELLFWVPQPNRRGLWKSRNTVVAAENPTKLDLTKFEYGNNWEKCRDRQ